jgi:hypothetical protein
MQKNGAHQDELEEYKRVELIRQSIKDVKKNAIANQVARISPKKLYSGVKSKIAGNLKSSQRSHRNKYNYTMQSEQYDMLAKSTATFNMSRSSATKSPFTMTKSQSKASVYNKGSSATKPAGP